MLPGMPGQRSAKRLKLRVAIVGAGNLASALAVALQGAGYRVEQIISRDRSQSLRRARRLALEVGALAVTAGKAHIEAEVVWFCVPDGAIAGAATALQAAADWSRKVALHSSGALTSDELAQLRTRGAAVASVHPMMTFVRGSRPSLVGVPFAIEGDVAAVRMARHIVKDLGGRAYSIRKEDKAAYHAWGTFASPLLTALLATTEHVATAAGLQPEEAKRKMLPILKETLANYAASGAARAFSGPMIRGDIDTVKRHLRVLRRMPVEKGVYASLAHAALAYLPGKNKAPLEKALKLLRRTRNRS
ncbi:MAG TPA: Rossmann-like and DUF2520 domain-containing protein [Candidatus Sulfotelmatobacter sp.]|nr:Rossmann-like and DUF2520 domain-containing protein [Candidatus Sulfotelmatobacter sp.]